MKTANRARRNGGKKPASLQSETIPQNTPGETPEDAIECVASFYEKNILQDEFKIPRSLFARLRVAHNEGNITEVTVAPLIRADAAYTIPISVGMIDELEQAIGQASALKSMLLSRIFHPDNSLKLTDREEVGLLCLCKSSFDRLDRAVGSLRANSLAA